MKREMESGATQGRDQVSTVPTASLLHGPQIQLLKAGSPPGHSVLSVKEEVFLDD